MARIPYCVGLIGDPIRFSLLAKASGTVALMASPYESLLCGPYKQGLIGNLMIPCCVGHMQTPYDSLSCMPYIDSL